jgi:hypothetical protein
VKAAKIQGVENSSQAALVEAKAKLSQIEIELRYLTGEGAELSEDSALLRRSAKTPKGPLAQKIRQSLGERFKLQKYGFMPLGEAIGQIQNKVGFPIVIDSELSDKGPSPTLPEGLMLREQLQAIEDQRGARFVIRDYGLLLTSRERAEVENFLTVSKFLETPAPVVSVVLPQTTVPRKGRLIDVEKPDEVRPLPRAPE